MYVSRYLQLSTLSKKVLTGYCSTFDYLLRAGVYFPLSETNFFAQIVDSDFIKLKMVTLVEGDQKAPFSVATTPRFRGRRKSFFWITPLYSWSLPYNAESPRLLANTLLIRPTRNWGPALMFIVCRYIEDRLDNLLSSI